MDADASPEYREVRCACNKLLFKVRGKYIEIKCPRDKILTLVPIDSLLEEKADKPK